MRCSSARYMHRLPRLGAVYVADRPPWYVVTDLRPTRKGINVHNHDGVLVAYSCISNAVEHWAVYERDLGSGVWSYTIFRETVDMEKYLNDPERYPPKGRKKRPRMVPES